MNSYLSTNNDESNIKPTASLKDWLSPLLEDDGDIACKYFEDIFPAAVLLRHTYYVHVMVQQLNK